MCVSVCACGGGGPYSYFILIAVNHFELHVLYERCYINK